MCWNKDISINTFIFSCLALVFIYFSNTYTKYKSPTFYNKLSYLLFFLVVSMQLIEYFIWKNLNNKPLNQLLSKLGFLLITLQVILFILLVHNKTYRYGLLFSFLLFNLYVYLFKLKNIKFKTTVAKNGHLAWEWLNFDKHVIVIGVLFYLVSSLLMKSIQYVYIFISIFFFFLAILWSRNEPTYGSLWCWICNLLLLFIILDILIIQPFYEYNGLC
jgi:hypothetical protein